jgi:acyl-coenzyme A synthetase/AMP-(fatty) acid ligase
LQEIIRYRGHHISPAELEFLLVQHPGVADAAVMGTSWEDTEVPRAAVVLRPGTEGGDALARDIVSFVEERVPEYKRLRGGVAFVQAIPRLVSGKICRKKLWEVMGA